MIDGFHSGDSFHLLGVVLLNVLDQFGLCAGRSGNQNSTSVRNSLCDRLKVVVIFRGVTASDGIRLVMNLFCRMIWMQDETFDVGWAETEDTGFSVIDPDDGMMMMTKVIHEINSSLLRTPFNK